MRFALRQLVKNPGFTVVALLTLALGIGVNTTAFTVLNRLLLQSLPYRDAGSLVQVWTRTPQERRTGNATGDYFDLVEQNTVFTGMAAYVPGATESFAEPGQPAALEGAVIMTGNFFAILGVEPELGRLPSPGEEERMEPVTLVSDRFWRQHFHADPGILGRTVRLGGKGFTVVGVMPPAMDDPQLFNTLPAFFPLDPTRVNREFRDFGWYTVVARMKPGVTFRQVQAELDVLGARFAKDHPKTNKGRSFSAVGYPTSNIDSTGRQLTWMTLALCGLVLLIACVNLANLQLVRTSRRAQEIGIRLALGCSRARVVGMLVLESLLLSVAGGGLGLLVALWSNAYVARYFGVDMPLDLRVIGFAFAAAAATGLVFGTFPAWMASRTDINTSLKSAGRGATSDRSRHWVRQGLVVAEIAMALTLLAGAGFFVSGLYRLTHRSLGWDPAHEVLGWIELDHDHFGEGLDPRSLAWGEKLQANLAALPGIEAAAISIDSPPWGFRFQPYRLEGQPPPEPGKEAYARFSSASPGFLKVYGLRLVQGREFTAADRPGAPAVVMVSESMARKFWPGGTALGHRVAGADPVHPGWAEIVGVFADFEGASDFGGSSDNGLKFMTPWAQNNIRYITFNVRTAGPSAAYKEPVRQALARMAPDLAPNMLETVEDTMAGELSYYAFLRKVLVQIAGLGLLLSAVGIYGVVANLASERTKEIGIRMALGAQPGSLVWLFLRNGLRLAAAGSTLGLGAAALLLVILGRMMPELPGRNPWVVAGVTLILFAVALLACWLPARRITRISPVLALRTE